VTLSLCVRAVGATSRQPSVHRQLLRRRCEVLIRLDRERIGLDKEPS